MRFFSGQDDFGLIGETTVSRSRFIDSVNLLVKKRGTGLVTNT